MSALLAPSPPPPSYQALAQLAVLSLPSPASRRNYGRECARFLASGRHLSREGVQAWLLDLREQGAGAVTRNIALAAIRLLARECAERGLLSDSDLAAIERIKGIPVRGQKLGRWLTLDQVKEMLRAAAIGDSGKRDAALVALMVGCGLRRAEVCSIAWEDVQRREDRMLVEVVGKGDKKRIVPIPQWVEEYIEDWRSVSEQGALVRVFVLSPQSAFNIVRKASRAAGLGDLAPHDLRRTWAKLARKGGASLEQIQQTLGHSSIQTTERYLGTMLEIAPGKAAVDCIGIARRKEG